MCQHLAWNEQSLSKFSANFLFFYFQFNFLPHGFLKTHFKPHLFSIFFYYGLVGVLFLTLNEKFHHFFN